ncbi:BolA family protein [Thioalkalivibrio sp. XN8]|uniref:BolA family protein n=1 Tax=Thioalkalivibrio sp. XN8 TaxID=2712863 RepID=UPI0013ECF9A4|nr:BolA family protein [Thioalkalivibrio sp. XN8]NGP54592.1 BolA family transcriptional regulator [Thioalkalivibrio sp. XN8]
MTQDRVEKIRQRLETQLQPELLEIEDESRLHAGHAGARDGRGHFRVMIVSPAFQGLSRIARHRLVFDAMGELMETDIHALAVQAFSPDEL